MARKPKKTRRNKASARRPAPPAPSAPPAPPPDTDALQNAIRIHQAGRLDEAEKIYRQILEADPGHADALHFLGVLAHQKDRQEEAAELISKAIAANPENGMFHYHLGNVRLRQGKLNDAAESFRRAVEANPGDVMGYNNLGGVLNDLGKPAEAIPYLEKAAALQPGYVDAHDNLGNAYIKLGRSEEAISCYEAILKLQPGHPQASHMLGALRGESRDAAPPEYVADLFDAYADQFESHLTEKLRYDVPRLLRAAVGEAAGAEEKSWTVLDMGCGTGLCGALFRDLAGRLIGADISLRMIEKARARGVYDELRVEDLKEALRRERGNLDLALSADVFVYAGALGDVFAGCAAALHAGGLFAFSIESLEGEGSPFSPPGASPTRAPTSRPWRRRAASALRVVMR